MAFVRILSRFPVISWRLARAIEISEARCSIVTNRFDRNLLSLQFLRFSTVVAVVFPARISMFTLAGILKDYGRANTMYDMAKLSNLSAPGQGATKAMSAFWVFDKAALSDGVVPKKYKELIALAVALTTQCPYCLELHRSAAEAAGATPAEVAETALVAAALRAGAAITHAVHLIDNHCKE
jgi:AhpD family alkylhydroperoxidase